jgi:hypothetical protein
LKLKQADIAELHDYSLVYLAHLLRDFLDYAAEECEKQFWIIGMAQTNFVEQSSVYVPASNST